MAVRREDVLSPNERSLFVVPSNDDLVMTQLLDLPSELLTDILSYLQPSSISAFSQTSVECHDFVESPDNAVALWKLVYLALYDDPRMTGWRVRPYDGDVEVINWKVDVKRVTKAVIYIRSVRLRSALSTSPFSITNSHRFFSNRLGGGRQRTMTT
jgi:hypothetical protein